LAPPDVKNTFGQRPDVKNTFVHVAEGNSLFSYAKKGAEDTLKNAGLRSDDHRWDCGHQVTGSSFAFSAPAHVLYPDVVPRAPSAAREPEPESAPAPSAAVAKAEKRIHVEKLKQERQKHVEELDAFFRTFGDEITVSEFQRLQASDEFIKLLRKYDIEDVPRNWVPENVREKGECRVANVGGRFFYEEPVGSNRFHGELVEQGSVSCWRARLSVLPKDELPRDGPSFRGEPKYVGDVQVRMLSNDRMETRITCIDEHGVEFCDWQPLPRFWRPAPVAEASCEEDRSFFEQVRAVAEGTRHCEEETVEGSTLFVGKGTDMVSPSDLLKAKSLQAICAMVMVYRRSKKNDHKSRLCEPCEYFHKTEHKDGIPHCMLGVKCDFCHVSSKGERNRFKKVMAKEKWNALPVEDKEVKKNNRVNRRAENKGRRSTTPSRTAGSL